MAAHLVRLNDGGDAGKQERLRASISGAELKQLAMLNGEMVSL